MQRIPIFIRASKHYNAVWRRGELIAAKRVNPGDALTVKPRHTSQLFSDYIFKSTKIPLPRSNVLLPKPPRPAASNICWKAIRRWQDAKRLQYSKGGHFASGAAPSVTFKRQ